MISRTLSKQFINMFLPLVVLLGSLPCMAQDAIDKAGDDTIRVIKEYERNHDAKAIRLWLTEYHGEATGHQVMIVFAEWAMKHQSDFISIAEGIKKEKQKEFAESFAFALTDSGSDREFKGNFRGYKSKVLRLILDKLP